MVFVKTFKGYEDKIMLLDAQVNDWIRANGIQVTDIKTCLSHEHQARSASGDLIYTILYEVDAPAD